ncbi:hypothetical protein CSB07_01550 [Candidatus Gracilibacteria bacterium]|nr:MAG: hypothetical protein CSB07_01550 [Candidatus Gracilibacteria bacterium]PIE85035.1 MAG: hypothetical protein CSA08_03790 [Candidatus Gracilibacteria bacterium]
MLLFKYILNNNITMDNNKEINNELTKYKKRLLRVLYFRESLLGRFLSFLKGGEKPATMVNDLIVYRGVNSRRIHSFN